MNSKSRATEGVRVGVAHHLGWAVAVTASATHEVVDRRRIDLIEPGMPTAPIENEADALADEELVSLIAKIRASVLRATSTSLDELSASLPDPVISVSLRRWPPDFPQEVVVQRRPPFKSHADSVMYREALSELAVERGWDVHLYDAKDVERRAARILGERADEVLFGPRSLLGAPWTKDHRVALAATIIAG